MEWKETSSSDLFWEYFSVSFLSSARASGDNVVAAMMKDRNHRQYLGVWSLRGSTPPSTSLSSLSSSSSSSSSSLRRLSCQHIQAFFPLPGRFKLNGICVSACVDDRGDHDAVVTLYGRSEVVIYYVVLEEGNTFQIALVELELEVGTVGTIKRRSEIPAEHGNSFMSVSCSHIGVHCFVLVCCSDGTVVIRGSDLERIRTLSSSSSYHDGGCAKMATFVDHNTVIAVYEYGHVICYGVETDAVLWMFTLQAEAIQKDDEFISYMHHVAESQRLIIGSQVGNVYILQRSSVQGRGEKLQHRCWERSVISLSKLLLCSSMPKANSVLSIADASMGNKGQFVVIITSALVAVIDTGEGSIVNFITFSNNPSIPLPIADACVTGTDSLLLLVPAFDRYLLLVDMNKISATTEVIEKRSSDIKAMDESIAAQSQFEEAIGTSLSYFQTIPASALPKESPLSFQYEDPSVLAEVKMKKHAFNSSDWSKPGKDKNGKLVNRPVTFHTRIKSSGYGAPSSHDVWKAKQEKSKLERLRRQSKSDSTSENDKGGGGGKRLRMYPVDQYPPTVPSTSTLKIASAIRGISYAEDATSLGVVTSEDTAVFIAKLPSVTSNSSYMGHNGRITSIHFSHGVGTASMILSSSLDGTVRLWSKGNVDRSSIVFAHMNHSVPGAVSTFVPYAQSMSTSKAPLSTDSNRLFSSPINMSRFFYMDNFVMISCKNSIHMYRFKLPNSTGESRKKTTSSSSAETLSSINSEGTYKSAHFWSLTSQSVFTFACINSVNSNLVIAAGSDKKLYILDANNGSITRTISAKHDTAVHHISIPQPSAHVQLPVAAYNIFATAAKDNCVLLWDLRQPTAVARLSTHVNRREAVECAISPCLQYLAVGSEDFKARVYDMVAGKELMKLPTSKDVVSSVAWNPLTPQLATSSFDGVVRFHQLSVS